MNECNRKTSEFKWTIECKRSGFEFSHFEILKILNSLMQTGRCAYFDRIFVILRGIQRNIFAFRVSELHRNAVIL